MRPCKSLIKWPVASRFDDFEKRVVQNDIVMHYSKDVSKDARNPRFMLVPEPRFPVFSCHAESSRKRTHSVDMNGYAFVTVL